VCYFAMFHGSYDSNLDSKRLILVIVIRSRSWPNIDGTYSTVKNTSFEVILPHRMDLIAIGAI
jgi:hypothetical protein